jgi:hypothetical protein
LQHGGKFEALASASSGQRQLVKYFYETVVLAPREYKGRGKDYA